MIFLSYLPFIPLISTQPEGRPGLRPTFPQLVCALGEGHPGTCARTSMGLP